MRNERYCLLLAGFALAALGALAQEAPQSPGAPQELRRRADALRAKGASASVTLLPVRVFSWGESSGHHRTESVGGYLEAAGLRNVEIGEAGFRPAESLSLPQLAATLGEYVRTNQFLTDCALYAEFTGDTNTLALQEMKAVVVDRNGAPVWLDRQTARDEAFRRLKAEQVSEGEDWRPDNLSLLLAERVGPLFGLNDRVRRAAQPKSVWGLLAQGRTGLRDKRYEEARDAFQKAAALDPSVGEAWSGQLGALSGLSRPQEAKAVLSRWLREQADSVAPWEYVFLTTAFSPRYKEALEALDRLIALKPEEGSYVMAKGQQLEALGRRDEAAELYAKAASMKAVGHEIAADAYRAAAELLRAKGKFAESAACCERWAALEPENPQPLYRRAQACAQSGEAARALADLKRAIALDPRLKQVAAKDVGFHALRAQPAFRALVK